jgi:predicted Fe-S protein YdhL (DUF1289 family)
MTEEEFIPSPCKLICVLNPDMICTGCHRSRFEITHWMTFSNEEKKEVWKNIEKRKE